MRRPWPIWVGLALGALLVFAVALKIATGFGPRLPGPKVRDVLGLAKPVPLCTPSPEGTRLPSGHRPAPGSWRPASKLPVGLDEIRAAAVGDAVYLGTGVYRNDDGSNSRAASTMFRFDPTSGSYTKIAPTPEPLDHTLTVAYRGDLYLVGGFRSDEPRRGFYRYSPATGRWSQLEPLKHQRGALAGAVIGDRLYAVGGSDVPGANLYGPAIASLEIYDFATGRWSDGPPMPTARHHVAAAALEGKLYVVGGRTPGDLSMPSFERFDPERGAWERLPPLPLGSGGLAAVAYRGEVVVISGGDDAEGWVTPVTWAFNPAGNRWRRLPDLTVARHGHGATVVDGKVYVFGGSPCALGGRTASVEYLAQS